METGSNPERGEGVEVSNNAVKITREEYRIIKRMKREEVEAFLCRLYHRTNARELCLESVKALESAMDEVKGVGPVKKAEIRKKYREKMEALHEEL
jgi:hypothetical protein